MNIMSIVFISKTSFLDIFFIITALFYLLYELIKTIKEMINSKKEYKIKKRICEIIGLFDKNYNYPSEGVDERIYIKDLINHLEEKGIKEKEINHAVHLIISSSSFK